MAWTTPMTAVANATFTAAQFNANIRDNLLMQAPAMATGQILANEVYGTFATAGSKTVRQRSWIQDIVEREQSSSSTSYTNLKTTGPSCTVTTGTAALVFFGSVLENETSDAAAFCSVGVTGATTTAADDDWCVSSDGIPGADRTRRSGFHLFTLTAGTNTFTMKYKVSASTGWFNYRNLVVWAL